MFEIPSYHAGYAPVNDRFRRYGCVSAWVPMLGATGLTLHDIGPRQRSGTLTNMVPATDWLRNQGMMSLGFPGSNDFVDIVGGNVLAGSNSLTVICVLNSVSLAASTSTICSSKSSGNSGWAFKMEQWNNTGNLGLTFMNVADYNSGLASPTEGVVGVAFRVGDIARFFANGSFANVSIGTPVTPSTNDLALGLLHRNGSTTDPFTGNMSAIYAFNKFVPDNVFREIYMDNYCVVREEDIESGFHHDDVVSGFQPAWAANSTHLGGILVA